MSGRAITITSGKGGVGKTTITANLAVALAALGRRVTAIDTDIGLRNLDIIMGMESRIIYDIVDVAEGKCHLLQALIRDKRLPNLYLLPASQTSDKTAISPEDMIAICMELKTSNDFVLIDSPAGIEHGFQNAIASADDIVIITTPEVSAVRSADRVIGLIEMKGKGPGRLIINRIKPAMVKRGDMLDTFDVIEFLAIDLLGVVPEDESVIVAANKGVPLAHEQSSMASQAFHNIARRLIGEAVPFLAIFEEPDTLWNRLRRAFRPADNVGRSTSRQ
jgi:septum site-determining protein MinD